MAVRHVSALVLIVACGGRPPPPPAPPVVEHEERAKPPEAAAPLDLDLDSKDVLARSDEAPEAYVKHVLFAWRELADAYQGRLDERAKHRTQEHAARLAILIASRAA